MIKLAIFDFDGTLADSFPWFTRVINAIAFGAVGWGFTRADALAAHRPACMFRDLADIAEHLCAAPPSPDAP